MYASLSHQSVLRREAIAALNIRADGAYVDGTFGRGGHAAAILQALGPAGRLIALDRDPAAERFARVRFQTEARFTFERVAFSRLTEVVNKYCLMGRIQGVLLDVGVSSPQLDDPQRGFSFNKDGPLDMRMDPTMGTRAAEWLATVSETDLSRVLREFGEERFHRRIAKAIVTSRQGAPIATTLQLANIIAAAVPTREQGKNPATRSFQAIRIFINRELTELEAALEQALQVLAAYGRLVVICFHSLEDRLVKRFMRRQVRGVELPPELPVPASASNATLRLIGRPVRPSVADTTLNPRSRSAVMRVAERVP